MLVLSRRRGEQIVIPDRGIVVTVLDVVGERVRLGISAPAGVAVHREEVLRRLAEAPPEEPLKAAG